MYKVPEGATSYFDVDDTLIMWQVGEEYDGDFVDVTCRGLTDTVIPNWANIKFLRKLSKRGHSIVVWSVGGSAWAEAVIKALNLEEFVDVVATKPTLYVDDKPNPRDWIGDHVYFTMDEKEIRGGEGKKY